MLTKYLVFCLFAQLTLQEMKSFANFLSNLSSPPFQHCKYEENYQYLSTHPFKVWHL